MERDWVGEGWVDHSEHQVIVPNSLDVEIYRITDPARRKILWELFAPYHYLNPKLMPSSVAFLGRVDGIPAAFTAAITMPSGTLKNAWREHRTVVLPDYQGLGIGLRLVDWSAEWHLSRGRRFYSRTTHPRIGQARDASPLWRATGKSLRARKPEWSNADGRGSHAAQAAGKSSSMKQFSDTTRLAYSHEYIGLPAV